MRLFIAALLLTWGTSASAQQVCAPNALPQVNTCTDTRRVSLALVGDVLLHRALQWRGYARGFASIWQEAIPLLSAADLSIANLEGPAAAGYTADGRRGPDPGRRLDDLVYTGYPRFNYHPVVIDDLRAAGVDIVTTANNHALDRGAGGLSATLDALDRARMQHVGAVSSGTPRVTPLRLATQVGDLSLIACTFGTNGIADPRGQVPLCHEHRAQVLRAIAHEAARGAGVLVLPHWGQEYVLTPNARQRRLAREMVAAGAMAVVGTHPHVPQPWDMMQGAAGIAPVIYSTGNFVAAQPPLERATSVLVWMELCAGPRGPRVSGAGYVPLQMEFEGADPSLTLPRPGMGGRAEAGRALLARLIPGHDLSQATDCRRPGRVPSSPRTPGAIIDR